jgi:hypothetical protein
VKIRLAPFSVRKIILLFLTGSVFAHESNTLIVPSLQQQNAEILKWKYLMGDQTYVPYFPTTQQPTRPLIQYYLLRDDNEITTDINYPR